MSDAAAGPDLQAIADRLAEDGLDPELVETLRTTLDELRVADNELARQNDELLVLHRAVSDEADRFRTLFDAAPIAYVATDRSGIITEANVAAARLFDMSPRHVVGKPIASYVDMDHRRVFRRRLLEVARGAPVDIPVRMRRRDRVAFEARARATEVGDEIMWAIIDETLLAQAEEQVWELNRELEQRVQQQTAELEGVIEQLPVGVVVVSPSGRLVRHNTAAQRVLGDPDEATIVTDWIGELRHLDETPAEPRERPAVRALAGEVVDATRWLRGDRVVDISATPLPTGAVLTVEDTTETHRRSEAERNFVSNAAHQIRTPITIISSVVAALQAGGRNDPDALRRFIDHIDGAVARLAGLAEALLTLARIQEGANAPARVVALSAVIEQAVGDRDATVRCAADAAAVADEKLLVEAVANLVDNAYVHGGGDVEVTGELAGTRAVIRVRDRGPGIAAVDRSHVLVRFVGSGSGLGLSIASEAAKAFGGTLELRTAEGGGLLAVLDIPGAILR